MNRNARWFRVFNALHPYTVSQEDCEEATNAVIAALARPSKEGK